MPMWAGSNRRDELPPDWYSKIRPRILTRDSYACQWIRADNGQRCGHPATDVDHIVAGGSDADENLRALCHWHHQRKSSREGGIASGEARRARKPGKLHPGLLP